MGWLSLDEFGWARAFFVFSSLALAITLTRAAQSYIASRAWKWAWTVLGAGAAILYLYFVLGITSKHEVARISREARDEAMLLPLKARTKGEPFFATVELRMASFGHDPSGKETGTGFWFWHPSAPGCVISPTHAVLFIRLENLRSTPVTITHFSVEVNQGARWEKLIRLPLEEGRPLFIGKNGFAKGNRLPLHFPEATGQFYLLNTPLKEGDFARAAALTMDTLDSQIRTTIPPNKPIRGWAFFRYADTKHPAIPIDVRINITDELGKTYSYPVPSKNGNPNEDTQLRLIQVVDVTDVSACRQEVYRP